MELPPTPPEAETLNQNPHEDAKGTALWALNVIGLSTTELLEEHEQVGALSG